MSEAKSRREGIAHNRCQNLIPRVGIRFSMVRYRSLLAYGNRNPFCIKTLNWASGFQNPQVRLHNQPCNGPSDWSNGKIRRRILEQSSRYIQSLCLQDSVEIELVGFLIVGIFFYESSLIFAGTNIAFVLFYIQRCGLREALHEVTHNFGFGQE